MIWATPANLIKWKAQRSNLVLMPRHALILFIPQNKVARLDSCPETEGAFLWGDLDQDQWSKITRIMVHQWNRWIRDQSGSVGSFDAPWSKWSWITDPDPDHHKGTHPQSITFSINLLFASSASNQGEVEITGSQSDLIKIDENQSPVSEGLKYYKPPKRTSFKKKTTDPKGRTGANMT